MVYAAALDRNKIGVLLPKSPRREKRRQPAHRLERVADSVSYSSMKGGGAAAVARNSDCCNQAMSQVCAFASPFLASLSAIEMLHQSIPDLFAPQGRFPLRTDRKSGRSWAEMRGARERTSEFQSFGKVILTTCPIPTGGGPKPQLET